MLRPKAVVILFVIAAGLGATSFAFAHMDFRQREERFFALRDSGQTPSQPFDQSNLRLAILFGIASAMTGAAAIGGFAMLFVPRREKSAHE